MEAMDYFKDAWKVVTLDEKTMSDLSKDKASLYYGLAIMFAVSLLAAVGGLFSDDEPLFKGLNFLFMPLVFLLGSLISVGVYTLFARWFGGRADFMSLYRPFLFTYILSIILIIPTSEQNLPLLIIVGILSLLVAIWITVVSIVMVRTIHQLSTGRAAAAVLMPMAIIFIVVLGIVLYFAATTLETV